MTAFTRAPCCIPFCPNEVYARVGESVMCGGHSGGVMRSTALALEREAEIVLADRLANRVMDLRPHQAVFMSAVLEVILCQLSPGLHGNEWRARIRAAQKKREMMAA